MNCYSVGFCGKIMNTVSTIFLAMKDNIALIVISFIVIIFLILAYIPYGHSIKNAPHKKQLVKSECSCNQVKSHNYYYVPPVVPPMAIMSAMKR